MGTQPRNRSKPARIRTRLCTSTWYFTRTIDAPAAEIAKRDPEQNRPILCVETEVTIDSTAIAPNQGGETSCSHTFGERCVLHHTDAAEEAVGNNSRSSDFLRSFHVCRPSCPGGPPPIEYDWGLARREVGALDLPGAQHGAGLELEWDDLDPLVALPLVPYHDELRA